MHYDQIETARFISRPNRFIAHVLLNEEVVVCHVKNTGRCRELLPEGAEVYIEKAKNPDRKTQYDLIAVKKGSRIINMDSQIPNAAVKEWLQVQTEWFPGLTKIVPEHSYGNSRFDFYLEQGKEKTFLEVKGVTLEEHGVVRFPDAPTERGTKHLRELVKAVEAGYHGAVLFVIQMKDVKYFAPNEATDPEFSNALRYASEHGVRILAFDCQVAKDSLELADPVKINI